MRITRYSNRSKRRSFAGFIDLRRDIALALDSGIQVSTESDLIEGAI